MKPYLNSLNKEIKNIRSIENIVKEFNFYKDIDFCKSGYYIINSKNELQFIYEKEKKIINDNGYFIHNDKEKIIKRQNLVMKPAYNFQENSYYSIFMTNYEVKLENIFHFLLSKDTLKSETEMLSFIFINSKDENAMREEILFNNINQKGFDFVALGIKKNYDYISLRKNKVKKSLFYKSNELYKNEYLLDWYNKVIFVNKNEYRIEPYKENFNFNTLAIFHYSELQNLLTIITDDIIEGIGEIGFIYFKKFILNMPQKIKIKAIYRGNIEFQILYNNKWNNILNNIFAFNSGDSIFIRAKVSRNDKIYKIFLIKC